LNVEIGPECLIAEIIKNDQEKLEATITCEPPVYFRNDLNESAVFSIIGPLKEYNFDIEYGLESDPNVLVEEFTVEIDPKTQLAGDGTEKLKLEFPEPEKIEDEDSRTLYSFSDVKDIKERWNSVDSAEEGIIFTLVLITYLQ